MPGSSVVWLSLGSVSCNLSGELSGSFDMIPFRPKRPVQRFEKVALHFSPVPWSRGERAYLTPKVKTNSRCSLGDIGQNTAKLLAVFKAFSAEGVWFKLDQVS